MKTLILMLVIGIFAFGGCSTRSVEESLDSMGDKVEEGLNKIMSSSTHNQDISRQEALSIALNHAGVTEDQISGLRTEYEVDDGVGHYDIRFLYNGQEYDYEISASNGKVLSFEVDD